MAPAMIARATSVSNVVQRVAAGLGVAVLATILANRISANLPPLPGGVSAASGGGLAAAHLPPALKGYLLAQATKGFDDTFIASVGLAVLCFPMALLLRRALQPSEVRAYAMSQLTEGVVLGAAARRLRDRAVPGRVLDRRAAFEVLADSASARLRRGPTPPPPRADAARKGPQRGAAPRRP